MLDVFFNPRAVAVIGASRTPGKLGYGVLHNIIHHNYAGAVYPINPKADEVEGLKAYPDLGSLPEKVGAISVITPPPVTEKVVEAAARSGVRYVWMQPGAESPTAVERARELGLEVIADGSCFLVVSGYSERS